REAKGHRRRRLSSGRGLAWPGEDRALERQQRPLPTPPAIQKPVVIPAALRVCDGNTGDLVADIGESLRRPYPQARWSDNDHVYFEAERWLDAHTVEVTLIGEGGS